MKRRHVIYISGYDPRSPRAYYLTFRSGLETFRRVYDVETVLSRRIDRLPPKKSAARWSITTQWPAGTVETEVDFLSWHDMAKQEFDLATPARLKKGLCAFWNFVRWGNVVKVWRVSRPFLLFVVYPWIMLALYGLAMVAAFLIGQQVIAALGAVPFGGMGRLGDQVPGWELLSWGGASVLAYLVFRSTSYFDQKFYTWYLINAWISVDRICREEDEVVLARIEAFAAHIVDAAAKDVDELLIVGHSAGSYVAVRALGRALELEPKLIEKIKKNGADLSLLTIGSNIGYAGFWRTAIKLKAAIAKLAIRRDIYWAEYFAPQDAGFEAQRNENLR